MNPRAHADLRRVEVAPAHTAELETSPSTPATMGLHARSCGQVRFSGLPSPGEEITSWIPRRRPTAAAVVVTFTGCE